MEYEKIKQLMEDMSNSSLTELEVEFPEGLKISLKKDNIQKSVVVPEVKEITTSVVENNAVINNIKKGNVVKSPMVGTFYAKPSPTADSYVEVGKEIKKGDTLCIIEAMKLMNEIESEYTGTIQEILVKDGEAVEFGTELFIIS